MGGSQFVFHSPSPHIKMSTPHEWVSSPLSSVSLPSIYDKLGWRGKESCKNMPAFLLLGFPERTLSTSQLLPPLWAAWGQGRWLPVSVFWSAPLWLRQGVAR